ncbi:MAG: hypothetical protein ACI4HN_09380, partial [Ruminococcus sp.]
YSAFNKPSESEIEKLKYDVAVKQDLTAVCKILDYLHRSGNDEACRAVESVYFFDALKDKRQNDISSRVTAFAQNNFISERNVWRNLDLACKLCASFRGLRTKSIKEILNKK